MHLSVVLRVVALGALLAGCGQAAVQQAEGPTGPSAAVRVQIPDCFSQDGAPVNESQGVRARDGECLGGRAVGYGPGVSGAPTPEQVTRDDGGARGELTVEAGDSPRKVAVVEREEERVVGRYSVFQLDDGTWLVDNYLTSLTNRP